MQQIFGRYITYHRAGNAHTVPDYTGTFDDCRTMADWRRASRMV